MRASTPAPVGSPWSSRVVGFLAAEALSAIGSWATIVAIWGYAAYEYDATAGEVGALRHRLLAPGRAARPARPGTVIDRIGPKATLGIAKVIGIVAALALLSADDFRTLAFLARPPRRGDGASPTRRSSRCRPAWSTTTTSPAPTRSCRSPTSSPSSSARSPPASASPRSGSGARSCSTPSPTRSAWSCCRWSGCGRSRGDADGDERRRCASATRSRAGSSIARSGHAAPRRVVHVRRPPPLRRRAAGRAALRPRRARALRGASSPRSRRCSASASSTAASSRPASASAWRRSAGWRSASACSGLTSIVYLGTPLVAVAFLGVGAVGRRHRGDLRPVPHGAAAVEPADGAHGRVLSADFVAGQRRRAARRRASPALLVGRVRRAVDDPRPRPACVATARRARSTCPTSATSTTPRSRSSCSRSPSDEVGAAAGRPEVGADLEALERRPRPDLLVGALVAGRRDAARCRRPSRSGPRRTTRRGS